MSYDRDSVSPVLDSSGGSVGGSPIPPTVHKYVDLKVVYSYREIKKIFLCVYPV